MPHVPHYWCGRSTLHPVCTGYMLQILLFLKYLALNMKKNLSNLAIIWASLVCYCGVKEGVKQEGFSFIFEYIFVACSLRLVFAPFCQKHLISQYGKLQDELEITSRVLGRRGAYSGTIVLMRNKATGEIIAEGRHSLFGRHPSKIWGLNPFHINVMKVNTCACS